MCELIEQQKSSTNTRLVNDAFLFKLPSLNRKCSDTFFERPFTCGAPYECNKLDERVRRLSMFKSEIKTVLILTRSNNLYIDGFSNNDINYIIDYIAIN